MRPDNNYYITKQYVSIHASVKDATVPMWQLFASSEVSIHASVKDATGI